MLPSHKIRPYDQGLLRDGIIEGWLALGGVPLDVPIKFSSDDIPRPVIGPP